MPTPRILAFGGSLRKDSFNQRLVEFAASVARGAGAEVTCVELGNFDIPIYDADTEASGGIPPGPKRLKTLFLEHDGLLLGCPEYNGSVSGVWKNAIDWISRPEEGEGRLAAFRGKVGGLVATSPSGFGGVRGLAHYRLILEGIGVMVIPEQIAIAQGHEKLGADGGPMEQQHRDRVEEIARRVVEVTGAVLQMAR